MTAKISALTSLIALSLVVACTTPPTPVVETPTNTQVVHNQTATLRPPTSTLINTLTKTLTPTLTRTPMPTLSAEDAGARILDLLSDNSACSFPCWWGWIPGETPLADVESDLNRVGSIAQYNLLTSTGFNRLIIPRSSGSYLSITLAYEGKGKNLDWLRVGMEMMHEVEHPTVQPWYEISWNDAELATVAKQYGLSEILSIYGKPSDVLISTYRNVPGSQPRPVSLVLFFPKHGFMVEYVSDGRLTANTVIQCPLLAFSYFWFWHPSDFITIRDVGEFYGGYEISDVSVDEGRFKTIEEATGMTLDEFYKTFTVDETACLETPANLWP